MIPFVDLKEQYKSIKPEITEAVNEVLDSTNYILGPQVTGFEEEFASYCHASYGLACNSGTSALHLALRSLGIGSGDEVITVAHTFIATIWAISYVGATPVFVDIDPDTYTLSPQKIEEKITYKTKAIIPVHLYGQPADMASILKIAKVYNLLVIEDAAQAHGAEYNNLRCGSLGDVGCFSFYPGKNLGAYGEGGAIVTDNEEIIKIANVLRDQGKTSKYEHELVGYNYRMDEIQAAILNVKLRHLERWIDLRIKAANLYYEKLSKIEEIKVPFKAAYSKHTYHLYVIQLESKEKRDSLQKYLTDKGVSCGLHYPVPVHLQKVYRYLGYNREDLPETEKAADCNLSLPMYPELGSQQISYICDSIKEWTT